MPTFIDGQLNIAALQVPGLYIDIIPPSPFLTGAPTNKIGLVGVGSWGPVNSVINVTTPDDCKRRLGTPKIRSRDIAWYVWCATKVGGAGNYVCVRVTDSTDTAATGLVQNTAATGSVVFTGQPTAAQTITLGGTVVTFVASGATGNQVNIGVSTAATLTALLAFLSGSADVNLAKATYGLTSQTLNVTYGTAGTGGNSFTLATNVTGATASGASLTSGGAPLTITAKYTGVFGNGIKLIISQGTAPNTRMVTVQFPGLIPEIYNNIPGTGNAFWVNVAAAINSGTNFRGPSDYVVASAGSLTTTPTLGTAVQLSGGTDGASGVTDSNLIGQDVTPRMGMYALRRSGIDTFTLCDLVDQTLWPTVDVFALSENAMSVYAMASGSSLAATSAARVSVGLDSFSSWILTGDYPTMYDDQNQVSRLVNSSAVAVGFCGNASPEQSPLNKVLRGISATEFTQAGTTYSDGDLSNLNTSGIDTVVGPPTTLGGDYFTFAAGRNAWSNTGGNGIEYTRVTNFIARSLNSFAAKSIVGMLQSTRPDDPTRTRAKQLLDGFFALLADPNSGSSGQGIIDTWKVVCDLTNNPPASQARGYLFASATVRYLNVVRYFVIRLAGGGNVQVSSSNDASILAAQLIA